MQKSFCQRKKKCTGNKLKKKKITTLMYSIKTQYNYNNFFYIIKHERFKLYDNTF
jgi:hypothetical protein